jgi:nucleoside 2-deoxyribosyltransferase
MGQAGDATAQRISVAANGIRRRRLARGRWREKEPGLDAAAIFAADVDGIDRADGLVAAMDGADPDAGRAWEVQGEGRR